MTRETRHFISLYFKDGLLTTRKKRDVTLAFGKDDLLYDRCKQLGSSNIKKIIGTDSYKELTQRANKDGRSINNYIKTLLRTSLNE